MPVRIPSITQRGKLQEAAQPGCGVMQRNLRCGHPGGRIRHRVSTVGAGENVVRLVPPLNVTQAEISEAVKRLSLALKRVAKPAPKPA